MFSNKFFMFSFIAFNAVVMGVCASTFLVILAELVTRAFQ